MLEWLYEPQDRISGHPSTAFATLGIGKIQKTHFHAGFEQFIYVVSGVDTQWLSGEAIAVSEGMFIHNPGYIEHALANTGEIPLKVLIIYLPGFHAAKSMKKKGLKKSPTFGVKLAFFSQYCISIRSILRLFTHFG
jgi:mannose-6-phosphate isomerase-like protein (cupin superfamily)